MTTEFIEAILEECNNLEDVVFGDAEDGGDERVEMFEREEFDIYNRLVQRVMLVNAANR